MERREVLGIFGAAATGAFAMSGLESYAQHPHHHDKLHGECLKATEACTTVCNETFHHWFEKVKDGHADHHQIAVVTIDCQEFCGLTAELLARESPLISVACLACAEACRACALVCSRHDDPQMKECALACKKCESACREMAKAVGDPEAESSKAK
jgi:hypothetical protein